MSDTRLEILDIARDLVRHGGVQAISFDAIAKRLGRTKQAVLYWFPNKQALLSGLYVPWLAAEADCAERATAHAGSQREAISAFVQAIAQFHLQELDRFRLTYLAPQMTAGAAPMEPLVGSEIQETTSRLYTSLERHLTGPNARARAVAIHTAVLGLITMVALADAIGDPLKHDNDTLILALIATLAG